MPPFPDSIKPHPRLILSPEKIASLKEQIKTDPVSRRMSECMRRKSEKFLDASPVTHEMEGRRLLMQSRLCLEHVSILSLTALLTGEDRFIHRAVREMEAAADFPDWNPSHFLDTGEMTLALALGYDWLFDHLTDDEKKRIASAIRLKGLEPSLLSQTQPSGWRTWTWWIQGTNNWTQVCHAGMVAGALALQEDDPQLAREFVQRAVENIPRAAAAYAPDGAYAEGPMYWSYGTSFHVVLIDLLTSVTRDDHGLAGSPGFLESAGYIAKTTAPTGLFYNYSDCRDVRCFEVPLFWFARRLDASELVQYELDMMEAAFARYEAGPNNHHENSYRLFPLALIWWKPRPASLPVNRPGPTLHWLGRGVNPISVHRSAWNDQRAVYIGIKGGSASSRMRTWTPAHSSSRRKAFAGQSTPVCRSIKALKVRGSAFGTRHRTAAAGRYSAMAARDTTCSLSTEHNNPSKATHRSCASSHPVRGSILSLIFPPRTKARPRVSCGASHFWKTGMCFFRTNGKRAKPH